MGRPSSVNCHWFESWVEKEWYRIQTGWLAKLDFLC